MNTYRKGVAPAATNIFTVGRRESHYQGNYDGFYTSRPVPF
jgi:hypothetical protein